MTDLFTRYVNGSTQFKADHMNAPLVELETEINTDKTNIDALEEDINQSGLSTGAGKEVLVNQAGTALEFVDHVFHEDDFVIHLDKLVYH